MCTNSRNFVRAFYVVMMVMTANVGAQAAESRQDPGAVVQEIEVGPYVSSIKYEEPGIMEETGFMVGAFGDFSAHYPQGLVVGIDGNVSAGLVDYESENTGSIDDITDFMLEARGTLGYDLWIGSQEHRLTPYAGLGYRFLRDIVGGEVSTTGALGYDRESNYIYIPIGLKMICLLNDNWRVGLNVEYDIFVDGTQKSELGDAIAGFDTVEHDQNEGYGVRGSVEVVRKMNRFDLSIKPFIRYWNIKQSDIQPITFGGTPIGVLSYEPKNNSTEVGLMVGLKY